mmetsp:Transcript_40713/g.113063  ORF Transcript_40713/g.113063 Transcript_40713/m.113063 type:complete len:248 (+) Transcript_40713:297-1040(+)
MPLKGLKTMPTASPAQSSRCCVGDVGRARRSSVYEPRLNALPGHCPFDLAVPKHWKYSPMPLNGWKATLEAVHCTELCPHAISFSSSNSSTLRTPSSCKQWSKYLSSPQGFAFRTSHSGMLLMKTSTASRESTSMGPCRPNLQLTRNIAPSFWPAKQVSAPQVQPQSFGESRAAIPRASSQDRPRLSMLRTLSVHVSSVWPGILHWPHVEPESCCSTGTDAIGAKLSTSCSLPGKKTASASTFTVQS